MTRIAANWSCWLLALACFASTAAPVVAQEDTDDPAAPVAGLKDLEKKIKNYLTPVNEWRNSGNVADKAVFDEYYAIRLKKFTHTDNAPNLAKEQKQFKDDLRSYGDKRALDAHKQLSTILKTRLPEIAAGDHLPAIRVSAVSLLGNLDSQESKIGEREAIPDADVLPTLLSVYKNEELLDAVRVVAMVGILRHAEAGVTDQEVRRNIVAAMFEVAAANEHPAGRSEEAHNWVRRRALDILTALKLTTTDGATTMQSLLAILDDEQSPIQVRCQAATALSRMKIEPRQKHNYARVANSLAKLSVSVTQLALGRRQSWQRLGGINEAINGVLPPSKPGAASPPEPVGGLLKWAAGTPHAEYVGKVTVEYKKVMDVILNEKDPKAAVANQLLTAGEELEQWLEDNPAPEQDVASN